MPIFPWCFELNGAAEPDPAGLGSWRVDLPVALQTPDSAALGNTACEFEGARGPLIAEGGFPEGGVLNWVLGTKASGENSEGS